jgi:hypothetical protein
MFKVLHVLRKAECGKEACVTGSRERYAWREDEPSEPVARASLFPVNNPCSFLEPFDLLEAFHAGGGGMCFSSH